MSDLYLVAHIVRGEPSFDIATREDIAVNEAGDEETFWIIPTSGHRAYPYWSQQIGWDGHILYFNEGLKGAVQYILPDPPADHPDHYHPSAAPKGQGLVRDLAERLGLVKRPTVTRR